RVGNIGNRAAAAHLVKDFLGHELSLQKVSGRQQTARIMFGMDGLYKKMLDNSMLGAQLYGSCRIGIR
uniref:hypothetical protein n=1 Tax=Neisseria cinerea TaxID=483 RepID=UPI003C7D0810